MGSATTESYSVSASGLKAKIIQTSTIEEVLPHIDEDTWFLVDLDNCLFEGVQALGHANWFYDELQKRIDAGMNREEATAEIYPNWIRLQQVCKVKPLESGFVPALQMLQGKGIPLMGLTHRQPSLADSTVKQVSSLDFNFLKTAPSKEAFSIPAKSPTLYFQGILFVGDYNKKVDLFEKFLSVLERSPKRVVFIDDKRNNVEELVRLTHIGIEYVGVHYTAIEHVKPIYDRELAELQQSFLDQILSNEAALLLKGHCLEE